MNVTNYGDEDIKELKGGQISSLDFDQNLEHYFLKNGHSVTIYDDQIQKPSVNKENPFSSSNFNSKSSTAYVDSDDEDDLETLLMIPKQNLLSHSGELNDVEYVYFRKDMRVTDNNAENKLFPLQQEQGQAEICTPLLSSYNHNDKRLSSFTIGAKSKVQSQTKRGYIQSWFSWCSRAFFLDKTKNIRLCTIYDHGLFEYGTILSNHHRMVMAMTYQPSISNFKYQLGCNLFQKAEDKIQLFSNLSYRNGFTRLGIRRKQKQSHSSTSTTTVLEYNLHNSMSRPISLQRITSKSEINFSMGGNSSLLWKFWQLQFWWKDPVLFQERLKRGLISHSIGVLWNNTLGIAWTWRVQYGSNAIIDIPVYLTSSAERVSFWNNICFATYLNALSFLLQKAISTVLLPKLFANTASTQGEADEEKHWHGQRANVVPEKKVKQHELQSKLMERKAKKSRRKEEEKNGLVILSAIYGYDDDNKYDVAIPLQFWIRDSHLELPSESSKKHLLGFPDLSTIKVEPSKVTNSSVESNTKERQFPASDAHKASTSSWDKLLRLADSCFSKFDSSEKNTMVQKATLIPWLVIRYKFENLNYQVAIQDKEGLILPSIHAKLLSPDDCKTPLKIHC